MFNSWRQMPVVYHHSDIGGVRRRLPVPVKKCDHWMSKLRGICRRSVNGQCANARLCAAFRWTNPCGVQRGILDVLEGSRVAWKMVVYLTTPHRGRQSQRHGTGGCSWYALLWHILQQSSLSGSKMAPHRAGFASSQKGVQLSAAVQQLMPSISSSLVMNARSTAALASF